MQDLNYDTTVVCTITDDSLKRKRRYTVSDGSVEFEAYAQEKTLSKGEQVLVTIPNGDYSMRKVIIDKVENDEVDITIYTTPLSQMQIFTEDILTFNEVEYGNAKGELLANDNDASSQVGPLFSVSNTDGNLNGYTRLGISADFQSLLSGSNAVKGSYGIKLYIYTDLATAPGQRDKDGKYEYVFSSNEMMGDPYCFTVPYTQEKVIDISNIDNIKKIEVHFYQDGNFITSDGDRISWQQVNGNIIGLDSSRLPNNLTVSNIKLYMGYALDTYENNSLFISCKEPNTYHYSNYSLDSGRGPDKHLELRWLHKFEGEELSLLATSIDDSIEVDRKPQGQWQLLNMRTLQELGLQLTWYRYNKDAETVDPVAGRFWEPIQANGANCFECSYMPRKEVGEERIKVIGYKIDTTYESVSSLIDNPDYLNDWNNIMNNDTLDDEQKTNELENLKLQYLVKYESRTDYPSEEFVLTNEVRVVDSATFDASSQLSIFYEDGSEGNYFIYDNNGRLINQGQGHGFERRMCAVFNGHDITPEMGKLDWIAWYMPVGAEYAKTMIVNTQAYYQKNNGQVFEEHDEYSGVQYICIRRYPDSEGKLNTYQSYSINDNWSNAYTNNTIRCEVSISGKVHTTTNVMRFGKAGSQGYNTTLILEMKDNHNAITISNLDYEKEIDYAILDARNLSDKEYAQAAKDIETKYLFLEAEDKDIKYIITGLPYDIKGNKLSPKLGTWEWKWKTEMGILGTAAELETERKEYIKNLDINAGDYDEQVIKANIMFNHLKQKAGKPYIEIIHDSKNEHQIELKYNIPDINYLTAKGFYGIIEATYTQLNETKLTAYLNIPLRRRGYTHIEGAQEITYSSSGSASYYPDAYRIFYTNDITHMPSEEYDGVTWSVLHDLDLRIKGSDGEYVRNEAGEYVSSNMALDYIPKLNRINRQDRWYEALIAASFYASGYDRISVECKNNSDVLWIQPLLITASHYDYSVTNNWDGGISTDEGTGTIMATVLGAGRKNEDNTFSGVLIGDVQDQADVTGGSHIYVGKIPAEEFYNGIYYEKINGVMNTTPSVYWNENAYYYKIRAATGVYGFQNGAISFSLKDNGVATFGKAGRGQIIIDGNDATLTSSGYLTSGNGMILDLDDGKLQIRESDNLKFQLDVSSPYLTLSGASLSNPMVYIGSDNCYLQSESRSVGGRGAKLDLMNGTFDIKGTGGKVVLSGDATQPFFEVRTDMDATLIHMDTDGYYLQSHLFEADSAIKLTKDAFQFEVYQQKPYIEIHTLNPKNFEKNKYYTFNDGTYVIATTFDDSATYYKQGDGNFFIAFDKVSNNIFHANYDSGSKTFTTGAQIDPYEEDKYGNFKYQIVRIVIGQGIDEVIETDPSTGEDKVVQVNYYDETYFYTDINQAIIDYVYREFDALAQDATPSGMRLDLLNGRIEGYNLKLIGTKVKNGKVENRLVINTEDSTTPVKIGGGFYINWDGSLTCTKINYISNTGSMPDIPKKVYGADGEETPYVKPIIELDGLTLYADGTGEYSGKAATAGTADIALEVDKGKFKGWMDDWFNDEENSANKKYLTIKDAEKTYLTINKAANTYLVAANAEQIYVKKEIYDKAIQDLQKQIDNLIKLNNLLIEEKEN